MGETHIYDRWGMNKEVTEQGGRAGLRVLGDVDVNVNAYDDIVADDVRDVDTSMVCCVADPMARSIPPGLMSWNAL
ncbi:hypothetical protein BSKO_02663 [Bryopsis sp. KO-2023]|nr:hypothetical protein BSKO_02663 [Bryopsis sp. KO-2023]